MAQLQQTSITGSIASTGSLIISGSEPVQLPLLNSGSGEFDLTTPYQLWFDSGDNNVKYHLKGSYLDGTWSSATPLITGRDAAVGAGNRAAGLVYGGSEPSVSNKTEEYNGSTWSVGGNLNIARLNISKGFGSQNAAMAAGGRTPTIVTCGEEYNGVSWAVAGTLITARRTAGAAGTQNAGLVFGGATPTVVSCNEEYNGTSFATGGPLTTARCDLAGGGTQNSGVAFGGSTPSLTAVTEHYNGDSWASGTSMNVARLGLAGAADCNVAALAFNGFVSPADKNLSEQYDGSTWSVTNPVITARRARAGAGIQSSAFVAGGESPTTNLSDEWTRPFVPPYTCNLPSSWAAGGAMIIARGYFAGSGTQNAIWAAGGLPGNIGTTEEYNGTSWSSGNSLITVRSYMGGTGTQNAGLAISGYINAATNATEEYNGTSWTAVNCVATGRFSGASAGTQNASYYAGGGNPGAVTCTELYDGTNWTAAGALNDGRYEVCGGGTMNAGIAHGGHPGPGSAGNTCHEQFNGSVWLEAASSLNAKKQHGSTSNGTQNDFSVFAGSPASALTENYNGVQWTEGPSMIQARYGPVGAASPTVGIVFGGHPGGGGYVACTEEYTGTEVNLATYTCTLSSAWSSGGAMITANAGYGARAGIQNAYAQVVNVADTDSHEHYNGTSWSNQTCYPYPGRSAGAGGADNEDFIVFGGNLHTCSAKWNGSSWSATNALNCARYYLGGSGTSNSTAAVGGYNGSAYAGKHEIWDGTNWTAATDHPTGGSISGAATGGTDSEDHGTAGINAGGTGVSVWNGSSWSSIASLSEGRAWAGGNGGTNTWLVFGGEGVPAPYAGVSSTEEYNGTSWSTQGNMIDGGAFGYAGGSGASVTAGIGSGRYDYPTGNVSCTEEYGAGATVFANLHCTTRCLSATCTQI